MEGAVMMEKPILFNTEMVQAILKGNKTSTRRPIKRTPCNDEPCGYGFWKDYSEHDKRWYIKDYTHAPVWWTLEEYISKFSIYHIGDTIWVRETWQESECFDNNIKGKYCYRANDEENDFANEFKVKWRPSIHMPKTAARLFLKVTDIRIERLQDITEDGAKGEGIRSFTKDDVVFKYSSTDEFVWQDAPRTAKEAFEKLWDSCGYKSPKSWPFNPWVWVIEFEKMK